MVRVAGKHRLRATPLAFTLLVCVASCGGGANGPERLVGAELVNKVAPSTVSIVTTPPGEDRAPAKGGFHAHGTGIIYDAEEGLVLTSNHFTEGVDSVKVRANERTDVQGRQVARAQCSDLSLLALNPKPAGLVEAKLGDSNRLREGERVTALGHAYPPGAPRPSLVVTEGALSAIDTSGEIHPELPSFPSLLLHQALLKGGGSGGPLVNDRGEVAGMNVLIETTGKDKEGLYSAITSNRLKELLAELKPGEGSRYQGWGDQHACHPAMARLTRESMVSHPPDGPARHGYRIKGERSGGGGHGRGP